MNVTIDTTITLNSAPSFDVAGKFVESYRITPMFYQNTLHPLPGVDGSQVKWFGFRERRMTFEVWYVSDTEKNVVDAIEADWAQIDGKTFTVTTGTEPDTTDYANCIFDSSASYQTQALSTGTGCYRAMAVFAIRQIGL